MSTQPVRDDLLTVAAIGVLAALTAVASHELVGHSGGCLAAGGDVRLVTTIFFRCDGGNGLTDLGGPLGNVAVGLMAMALTASRRVRLKEMRVFLLLSGGLALFWFFSQLVVNGLTGSGDWSFAAGQLACPSSWRLFAVAVGAVGYDLTRRGLTRGMLTLSAGGDPAGDRRRFLVPWAAGMIALTASAALFAGDRLGGIRDTALTLGLAPLGLALALVLAERFGPTAQMPLTPIPRRRAWIIAAGILYSAFCLIVAPGLGGGTL